MNTINLKNEKQTLRRSERCNVREMKESNMDADGELALQAPAVVGQASVVELDSRPSSRASTLYSMEDEDVTYASIPSESVDDGEGSRKRPYERRMSQSTSADEVEDLPSATPKKISSASRGKGRIHGVAHTHGLAKSKRLLKRLENEAIEKQAQREELAASSSFKKKKSQGKGAPNPTPEGRSPSPRAYESTAGRSYEEVLGALDTVQQVVTKSRNIKGTCQGAIYVQLAKIKEHVCNLSALTVSEETRRLRADNSRLSQKMNLVEREMGALKQAVADSAAKSANVEGPTPQHKIHDEGAAVPQNRDEYTQFYEKVKEDVKRELMMSWGGMLNARLEGLEDRLLPAKSMRPPLAADKRRAEKAARTVSAAAQVPAVPVVHTPPVPAPRRGRPPKKAALQQRASSPRPGPSAPISEPPARGPLTEETWATVVHKKKNRPATTAQLKPKPVPKPAPVPKPRKLTPPKTAAVVISLQPDAVARGVTYSATLLKARQAIKLSELGIQEVKVKTTATGARMVEVPGPDSGPNADRLAAKLCEILAEEAIITRPSRRVDLCIVGLDNSMSGAEVAAAVAAKGECSLEEVRVSEIRFGFRGEGSLFVRCPVTAAKIVAEGKLQVGWSSYQVKVLAPMPMRCYKCMSIGHTRQLCPMEVDRTEDCYRCGKPGHKASTCTAEPKCAVCTQAQKPANHVMGGRICSPPTVRGKAASEARVARGDEQLRRGVEMDL